MRPIFDAHLDLAWNALYFDRDLLADVPAIRRAEKGMTDEPARGGATVNLPELRQANVAVCVATLLARSGPELPFRAGFRRTDLDYKNQSAAYGHAMGQLAYYRWLEDQVQARILKSCSDLDAHWASRKDNRGGAPLGIILGMEGCDPIVTPKQVQHWWEQGLRVAGPAHYGHSHYAAGTGADGPFTASGLELLKQFREAGMILDVTHLCDRSFFQAMDCFPGPVLASHHNCRALVPSERQLSDEQIRLLIDRDSVIGTAFDAWMLFPGWKRGETKPSALSMAAAADHIDHICQLAGNARHCGLGSDLDGGFGNEQTPGDLDTYSDLHKLAVILAGRGYREEEVNGIFFGNWLRFFRDNLG